MEFKRPMPLASFALVLYALLASFGNFLFFVAYLIEGWGFSSAFTVLTDGMLYPLCLAALGVVLFFIKKELAYCIGIGAVALVTNIDIFDSLTWMFRNFSVSSVFSYFNSSLVSLGWLALAAIAILFMLKQYKLLKFWFVPAIPFAVVLLITFISNTVEGFRVLGGIFDSWNVWFDIAVIFNDMIGTVNALLLAAAALLLGRWFFDMTDLEAYYAKKEAKKAAKAAK